MHSELATEAKGIISISLEIKDPFIPTSPFGGMLKL